MSARFAPQPSAAAAANGPATGPAGPGPGGPAGRAPATPAALTDDVLLLALVRRFAALYLEVEAGRRVGRQLAGFVTPRLAGRLAGLQPSSAVGGQVATIAGTRSAPDRFDAVVVVRRGGRYGALAVRLVHLRGEWRVDQAGCPEQHQDNVRSDRPFIASRPLRR